MAVELPPWLNVQPAQSAEFFLHGYGQGASAGAAARAAAQRDEELAFREEQARQTDAIRQQEQQLATEKFGLDLREKQRAAEREAQEAAMQLEGQQQLSKDLAAGKPIHEALAAAGPKLFYRHPEKMFQALHQVTPPPLAPAPQWVPPDTATGAPGYMRNLKTGGASYPPASLTTPGELPTQGTPIYDPVTGRYLGSRLQTGPRTATILREPAVGQLSDVAKAQRHDLELEERAIRKELLQPSRLGQLLNTSTAQAYKSATNRLAEIKQEKAQLLSGKPLSPETAGKPLLPRSAEMTGPPAPPAVGTIKNGFRFKGGHPGLKENWEEVAAGKIDESTAPEDNTDEEEE